MSNADQKACGLSRNAGATTSIVNNMRELRLLAIVLQRPTGTRSLEAG